MTTESPNTAQQLIAKAQYGALEISGPDLAHVEFVVDCGVAQSLAANAARRVARQRRIVELRAQGLSWRAARKQAAADARDVEPSVNMVAAVYDVLARGGCDASAIEAAVKAAQG